MTRIRNDKKSHIILYTIFITHIRCVYIRIYYVALIEVGPHLRNFLANKFS